MSRPDREQQRRARSRRARARDERAAPHPDLSPPTHDDWAVEDGPGLRRVRPPTPVGESLDRLVRDRRWADRLEGVAVHARWREICGPQLAERCEPVRLAGGRLVIRTDSQPWATQLTYMASAIRDRANELLGAGKVREVVVTVGPLGQDDGQDDGRA